ncbi:MAG: UDP-N-acetylglucosamine 1-carboxyvinyltransferase [Thermodesulfobacteriota bacterium]|nr:UDP-N-acetylglucosamine 1-carboxyvinyltransferase [Thermodesulfobacteriota bacterium]
MEKIVIKGEKRLKGEVEISGSKNAALPILTASILTQGWNTFSNVPVLRDIETIKRLLKGLGIKIKEGKDLRINADSLNSYEASYDLVKTMRASVLVLGPLLAKLKRAKVSLPGGCAIGARPINLHLKGLAKLGAKIELKHGYVEAKAKKLKGAPIFFDISTVTGTENLMMAATLAEGVTTLENAAREPEVIELACILKKMGANIKGEGTEIITIEGVKELKSTDYTIIPDRIEAGTFMTAAGITGGNIRIKNCNTNLLDAVTLKLKETGLDISNKDKGITVKGNRTIRSVDIKTLPYPGFPTDMQAQMMAFMCFANGTSVISETVFENRFMHVSELQRMGADIRIEGHNAIVKGVPYLSGAPVMATDLRASACLILAGLAAKGETEISRVYHIDRGYESIVEKLSKLGADIKRVSD